MVLQPSQARRRSGSHYTPRELTEPIVRTALEPILARLRGTGGEPPTPEAILDLKVCDPAMGSGAFLVEACRQLGDALLDAWRAHDAAPAMAAGDDKVVVARRLVAQRCLYGVDRNPMAVDLAKVSLWLATLAKEHPLTFVDHALRHGDSLVGLMQRQIEAFHWEDGAEPLQQGIETIELRKCLARVADLRRRIREADETVSDWELRDWWDEARFELGNVRLFGDLVIAAFFEGGKPTERKARRDEYAGAVFAGEFDGYRASIEQRRWGDAPLAPFHWDIEFPEAFDRAPTTAGAVGGPPGAPDVADGPGFDAIVGNPPFAGKNSVAAGNVAGYPDWLKQIHSKSHGNADLVAHFFRRAFTLVRRGGTSGLIATNTIAQGDTRSTGLRWICTHGGQIYNARRRRPWPGQAAVVVSVVHVHKGSFTGPRRLDDAATDHITAFLFHRGGHDAPARLAANAGKSFVGSYVLGMGFTFDDADTKGVASSLADMRQLIEKDPRNQQLISPYIGGHEVNTSPTHANHRYIINFHDYPLCREGDGVPMQAPVAGADRPSWIAARSHSRQSWTTGTNEERRQWLRKGRVPEDYPDPVAADWPDLLALVRDKVRPVRVTDNREAYRRRWWKYAERRFELLSAIADMERVLVTPQTSNVQALAFLPSKMVFGHTLIIFPFTTYSSFAVLQSRVHQIWSAFLGPTMKDDLRYTPSDCFETFPFPACWETDEALETVGRQYYEFRAKLMMRNNEGLTKTYNRFHDPCETHDEIAELRSMHSVMDRAVTAAYGWADLEIDSSFLADGELPEGIGGGKRQRYGWHQSVRDEILARLLELNAKRSTTETVLTGRGNPRQADT